MFLILEMVELNGPLRVVRLTGLNGPGLTTPRWLNSATPTNLARQTATHFFGRLVDVLPQTKHNSICVGALGVICGENLTKTFLLVGVWPPKHTENTKNPI